MTCSPLVAGLCLALFTPGAAHAQSTDAEFAALLKKRNVAAAESLARERTAQNPKDDVAWWYLARLSSGSAAKRDALIPQIEQCAQTLPRSARCHSALGTLYGSAAMAAGISGGLKYVGRIKESMLKAVELDPAQFDMRRDLVQFYLQAPGIAGGSVRKAIEQSNEYAKYDTARAQLLRADVHVYEKEFAKAEELIAGIRPGVNTDLGDAVAQAYAGIGFAMVNAEQHSAAQQYFEKRIANAPTAAIYHFGLGRALLEQKFFDRAVQAIEKALQFDSTLTAHYRLGIAYQGLGDKLKAIAAFKTFLGYQGQGRAADDARKRLTDLGG